MDVNFTSDEINLLVYKFREQQKIGDDIISILQKRCDPTFFGSLKRTDDLSAAEIPHQKNNIPTFSFYKSGNLWWVGKKGKEKSFNDDLGFRYLHMLLCSPNQEISAIHLASEGKSSSLSEAEKKYSAMSPKQLEDEEFLAVPERKGQLYVKYKENEKSTLININDLKKRKTLLKEKIEEINSTITFDKDPNAIVEKKDRFEKKLKVIKEAIRNYYNPHRQEKDLSEEQNYRNVASAIRRALKKIYKYIPELKQYLNESTIKKGLSPIYIPNNAPPIEIICFNEDHS